MLIFGLIFVCGLLILGAFRAGNKAPDVRGALLYTRNEASELEYNVVYKAPLASHVWVRGCGIKKLDTLAAAMGRADTPPEQYGTRMGPRTLGKAVTADLTFNKKGQISRICVTAVNDRPIVGISWMQETLPISYHRNAQALERNGAYAVFLPQVTDEEEARAVLEKIDGIFMSGGGDWSPRHYGQIPSVHGAQRWNRLRDASDLHMIRQAIAMDVPLLGVCRGAQGLNIAMEGGLIQDVPFYLGQKVLRGEITVDRVTKVLSGTLPGSTESVQDMGYIRYNRHWGRVGMTYDAETGEYMKGCGCRKGHLRVEVDGLSHKGDRYHVLDSGADNKDFVIDPDSKWLAGLLDPNRVNLIGSSHHQAIDPDDLGQGITVAARSSDGIIEAIEYRKNRFALGVQWHPEWDTLGNSSDTDMDHDACNAILRALVEHARMQKRKEAASK